MNNKIGYHKGKHENNNIIAFLKKYNETIPEKTIFYTQDEQITYSAFYRSIQQLAAGFENIKITKNDHVILMAPMTPQLYLTLFALNYIGAIPVFIESLSQKDTIKHHIKKIKPTAIIAPSTFFTFLHNEITSEHNCTCISIDTEIPMCAYTLKYLLQNTPLPNMLPVTGQHTALLTFTTGSSGEPKGVVRSHRFLAAQHYALSRIIPYSDNAIDLPTFPIFSLNNIASGISTILPNFNTCEQSDETAQKFIAQIKKHNINYATVSPMIFNTIANYCTTNNLTLPPIKRVITGGAPLSRDDLLQFQRIAHGSTEIFILYGSTEVEPITCISAKETLMLNENLDDGANVGQIDKALTYKIIKPTSNIIKITSSADWNYYKLPKNQPGELIVSGEHVCETYFENNDAFYKTKIIDIDGTIWHRTGDIVRADSNNRLIMLGRKHNIITHKNGTIYPIIAETLIKKLSITKDAAIVHVLPNTKKQLIFFAITPIENINDNKKKQLKKDIKTICKNNNIPVNEIVFIQQIPRDHRMHSKIDYATLAQILIKDYVQ